MFAKQTKTDKLVLQPDQINMAVLFRYLVKVMLVYNTVHKCAVAYTGQVTFFKETEKHGHVCLDGLL